MPNNVYNIVNIGRRLIPNIIVRYMQIMSGEGRQEFAVGYFFPRGEKMCTGRLCALPFTPEKQRLSVSNY